MTMNSYYSILILGSLIGSDVPSSAKSIEAPAKLRIGLAVMQKLSTTFLVTGGMSVHHNNADDLEAFDINTLNAARYPKGASEIDLDVDISGYPDRITAGTQYIEFVNSRNQILQKSDPCTSSLCYISIVAAYHAAQAKGVQLVLKDNFRFDFRGPKGNLIYRHYVNLNPEYTGVDATNEY